jgi:hypothetical protein
MENEFDEMFSSKDLYNYCLKSLCIHHSHLAMAFEEDVKKDKVPGGIQEYWKTE